jgi:hypothetical protein
VEGMAVRRTRVWTPSVIPLGLLIALLGAWAFFVPLVGGYFSFGFDTHSTWLFSGRQWELELVPGVAAFVGGMMLMMPARGWGWLGGLLAVFAGAWLLVGPSFHEVYASGALHPIGSPTTRALRWVGYFYGVGGLVVYLAGWAQGLFSRRTVVQEMPIAGPEHATRTVTPQ